MEFAVKKGTNISHWLSQSTVRGEKRREFFTERDVEKIASMGFDHIRMPIDEEQMWDEAGGRDNEAFELLANALNWADRHGLKIIVDLHILRSHYFNDKTEPRLYSDPAEQRRFVDLWLDLSRFMHERSVRNVAYEFLNEAVARDHEKWNELSGMVFAALREVEPERVFVLGSNNFNSVHTYDALRVPKDDNLILTFHYYHPMLVTHYQARWWDGGEYAGPVTYPGSPIPADHFATLDDQTKAKLKNQNLPFDREVMRSEIAKPVTVARRHGYPIYCGEFGCYNKTPEPLRDAWYRDVLAVFDEYSVGWANWDYKGHFGIVDHDRAETPVATYLTR